MENTSDRIKMFASTIFEKIGDYKAFLIIFVIIVIVIFIGYYLSYSTRTGKKVDEVLKSHKSNIRFQTDYCHENYRRYNLVDFHILHQINLLVCAH